MKTNSGEEAEDNCEIDRLPVGDILCKKTKNKNRCTPGVKEESFKHELNDFIPSTIMHFFDHKIYFLFLILFFFFFPAKARARDCGICCHRINPFVSSGLLNTLCLLLFPTGRKDWGICVWVGYV